MTCPRVYVLSTYQITIYLLPCLSNQEIYKDRKKFSKQVFEVSHYNCRRIRTLITILTIVITIHTMMIMVKVASSDLVNMGITVVSYTLKDIRDEEGYLKVAMRI